MSESREKVGLESVNPAHIDVERANATSFNDGFSVLDFLIFVALLEGEMYSAEIAKSLPHLKINVNTPDRNLVYARLKNLVRDEFLTSRKESESGRIYFSIAPKGKDRLNATCVVASSLLKAHRKACQNIHKQAGRKASRNAIVSRRLGSSPAAGAQRGASR